MLIKVYLMAILDNYMFRPLLAILSKFPCIIRSFSHTSLSPQARDHTSKVIRASPQHDPN